MKKPHMQLTMSERKCTCGRSIKQNVVDRMPERLGFDCYLCSHPNRKANKAMNARKRRYNEGEEEA